MAFIGGYVKGMFAPKYALKAVLIREGTRVSAVSQEQTIYRVCALQCTPFVLFCSVLT